MKVFVITTFIDSGRAKKKLVRLNKHTSLDLVAEYSSHINNQEWQQESKNEMDQSDAIIVFNRESCATSDKTKWLMAYAISEEKLMVDFTDHKENLASILKLESLL